MSRWLLPGLGVAVLAAGVASEKVTTIVHPPGPTRIMYWEKWTGFEFDAIKAIVNDFNKSQNRIFVDLLPVSNISQKTMMAVSAGIPPDVAGLFGPNVAQYADDGAVIALDDLCREAGITPDHYIPAYYDIGVYRGRLWSLPSTPASTALHYNRDLFAKAGLDPDRPPQTIEELDAMADKMTTRKPNGTIDVSGFLPSEPGWWNWSWGYFFGGALWDEDSKITASAPENVRAFEWVQSYSKKYGPGNIQTFRSGFGNFSSPQNAFMSQKVGMELQGVWMYNFITQYAPEIRWSAAPFPHPADRPDLANLTMVDEDVLVIPRGAKHVKEAFEFIAYVQSQPAMEKLCLLQKKNSPLSKVSDHFWSTHENPYIRLFYDLSLSKNSIAPPKLPIWAEYGSEMNNAFDKIQLMQTTPLEALKAVDARMQPRLDQVLDRQRRREAKP